MNPDDILPVARSHLLTSYFTTYELQRTIHLFAKVCTPSSTRTSFPPEVRHPDGTFSGLLPFPLKVPFIVRVPVCLRTLSSSYHPDTDLIPVWLFPFILLCTSVLPHKHLSITEPTLQLLPHLSGSITEDYVYLKLLFVNIRLTSRTLHTHYT